MNPPPTGTVVGVAAAEAAAAAAAADAPGVRALWYVRAADFSSSQSGRAQYLAHAAVAWESAGMSVPASTVSREAVALCGVLPPDDVNLVLRILRGTHPVS